MKLIPRLKYCDYESWGHFSRLKINSGWKALDVGCGSGFEVAYLRSLGMEAYGLDNDSAGFKINPENFFFADATAIPCKSDCFDLVLCLGVVQHISEGVRVINEINRVLKTGGKLVLFSTNKYGITFKKLRIILKKLFRLDVGYDYYKLYSQKELVNILKKSGFDIVTTYTTRFIPYRLKSYQHFGEYIIGILFWLEKNIVSKVVIVKNIGVKIIIIAEKNKNNI